MYVSFQSPLPLVPIILAILLGGAATITRLLHCRRPDRFTLSCSRKTIPEVLLALINRYISARIGVTSIALDKTVEVISGVLGT